MVLFKEIAENVHQKMLLFVHKSAEKMILLKIPMNLK